jgi:hypothetical protein
VLLPRHEERPYFRLQTYPQGFDKDSMKQVFNIMDVQQKIKWNHKDSLDYFFALVATDAFDDALALLKRIHKFEPRNLEELHLTQYLFSYKRRYDQIDYWLNYEAEHYPENRSHIVYRRRIHKVEKLMLSKDWSFKDSIIFRELIDLKWKKMVKGSKPYLEELIPLVARIDSALRIETKYEFKSNISLAFSFLEFGLFLDQYVSTSDAFIALSIARFYDRFNPQIIENYRSIRSKMNQKRFIFPSFREVFSKQSRGYFNINSIKKRRLAAKTKNTQREMNPETLRKVEVRDNALINDKIGFWIIFGGLILLLLFVAIFVKT